MRGINKEIACLMLLLFGLVGGALIKIGVSSYYDNLTESATQFNIRTPISYITHKIKQCEVEMPMEVKKQGETQALVLYSKEKGTLYETWIYELDHELCEAYTTVGKEPDLNSGTKLMAIGDLAFDINAKRLRIEMTTKEQAEYELLFSK